MQQPREQRSPTPGVAGDNNCSSNNNVSSTPTRKTRRGKRGGRGRSLSPRSGQAVGGWFPNHQQNLHNGQRLQLRQESPTRPPPPPPLHVLQVYHHPQYQQQQQQQPQQQQQQQQQHKQQQQQQQQLKKCEVAAVAAAAAAAGAARSAAAPAAVAISSSTWGHQVREQSPVYLPLPYIDAYLYAHELPRCLGYLTSCVTCFRCTAPPAVVGRRKASHRGVCTIVARVVRRRQKRAFQSIKASIWILFVISMAGLERFAP